MVQLRRYRSEPELQHKADLFVVVFSPKLISFISHKCSCVTKNLRAFCAQETILLIILLHSLRSVSVSSLIIHFKDAAL